MNRKDLVSKLNLLKLSLSTIDIIPSLQYFYFSKDRIIACNGNQLAQISYETGIDCLLPGNVLLGLLKSYTSDEVRFEQKDDGILIRSGSSRTKLSILPKDSFISIGEEKEFNGMKVPLTINFIDGLERCLVSLADNIGSVSMSGVTLNLDHGSCRLYSTDDITISKSTPMDIMGVSTENARKVLLPKLFCEQAVIWFKEFGSKGEILIGKDSVKAQFSNGSVLSKINLEVEYQDFETIISVYKDINFFPIPDNFGSILDRSLLFTSSEVVRSIRFESGENYLNFESEGRYGSNTDKCTIESDFENLQFSMDAVLLKRALPLIKEFSIIDRGDVVIFIGRSDCFIHLISSLPKE